MFTDYSKANHLEPSNIHPQGGTLFSYIRRLGSFFGFKIEFQFLGGGFQKNEHFFGYEDCVDIFWGHHKIGLYLGVYAFYGI